MRQKLLTIMKDEIYNYGINEAIIYIPAPPNSKNLPQEPLIAPSQITEVKQIKEVRRKTT